MAPLLIVDSTDRPDLEELVRVHSHVPPGDVDIQWAVLKDAHEGMVALILSFQSPIKAVALLGFDIVQQGILVEQILTSKVLYLQGGRPGDRFITTQQAERIFVEVVDTGFRPTWEKLWHKYVAKEMRKKGQLSKHEAKEGASDAIAQMRRVSSFRMTK